MVDPDAVDLEEYKQLRAEIVARTTIGNQIAQGSLAAIAAGLAVAPSYPEILFPLAFASSWAWLMHTSHESYGFRLAHYVMTVLSVRLTRNGDGRVLLAWEDHLRQLNLGRLKSRFSGRKGVRMSRLSLTTSMTILFGACTPTFVGSYWLLHGWPKLRNIPDDLALTATVAVIAMWSNGCWQAYLCSQLRQDIDRSIQIRKETGTNFVEGDEPEQARLAFPADAGLAAQQLPKHA